MIGVIAAVVLIDVVGVVLLLVVDFISPEKGKQHNLAYSDTLLLLERGVDPTRTRADGMTFEKILAGYRAHFQATHKSAPTRFAAVWGWSEKHGVFQQGH